uniref:Uncharacterized protein n=1 Tax=Strigamia maritima TaxID=126957 RepID=T1IZJ5_STRMM
TIDSEFLRLLTFAAKNRSSPYVTGDDTLTDAITLRQLENTVHMLDQEGAYSPSAARVLLFSCGHHYTSCIFTRTVLPRFEASMRTLLIQLTRTTQALLASYSSDVLQPMACPRCVFVRIKENTESKKMQLMKDKKLAEIKHFCTATAFNLCG